MMYKRMKHFEGCNQLLLVRTFICVLARLYAISKDSWMYLDPPHDTRLQYSRLICLTAFWLVAPRWKLSVLFYIEHRFCWTWCSWMALRDWQTLSIVRAPWLWQVNIFTQFVGQRICWWALNRASNLSITMHRPGLPFLCAANNNLSTYRAAFDLGVVCAGKKDLHTFL